MGTAEFAGLVLQNLETTALRHREKHGHSPDTVIIYAAPRLPGPQNRRQSEGSVGLLGPYRVAVGPPPMFSSLSARFTRLCAWDTSSKSFSHCATRC